MTHPPLWGRATIKRMTETDTPTAGLAQPEIADEYARAVKSFKAARFWLNASLVPMVATVFVWSMWQAGLRTSSWPVNIVGLCVLATAAAGVMARLRLQESRIATRNMAASMEHFR